MGIMIEKIYKYSIHYKSNKRFGEIVYLSVISGTRRSCEMTVEAYRKYVRVQKVTIEEMKDRI